MEHTDRIKTPYNSIFAIGGVSCSADSLVVAESLVLRINICAKIPPLRKATNRYASGKKTDDSRQ